MQTVYFSDGTTARVTDVCGEDPRTFTIPADQFSAFARAMTAQVTAQFGQNGPVYLLTGMRGSEGRAVLQVTRR